MLHISEEIIDKFSKKFNSKNINNITKNAINNNKLSEITINGSKIQKRNNIFSKRINVKVKNTEQKDSGRCWIFAFLNAVRLEMIQKYNLEETFEFSQNYLFFWDKLEKCNYFIYNIINTKHLDLKNREINFLLNEPIGDGGQWNMIKNLVNKYGIIPKTSMNETVSSEDTYELNYILNNKLRAICYEIRNSEKEITENVIASYMEEIYKLLVLFLGEPPKKITWEYYSNNGDYKKYNVIKNITPLDFYKKYIPYNVNDKICLINSPLTSSSLNKPYYNLYNVKYCGNIVNGEENNFINIPIELMLKITKKSIDNDKAVWFGSDMDHYFNDKYGILDTAIFDYNSIINMNEIVKDKGFRLDYSVSKINHAMLIKGYDAINNNVTKWLVENSWGDNNELYGNISMSNDWFKEFVFQIVVDKKFVNKEILNVLNKKPILLNPWDPFGVLLGKKGGNIGRKSKSKKYTLKKKNIQ